MKHLGDISKINGADIEPVDLITFGSPCQDLSVAGKRAGMKHEANGDGETTRSGLFVEAVRIIKEMREATNGKYPRFALWENVPGAFSSNRGEDFRSVLEELIQVSEPGAVMPEVPKKGWAYADSYVGDGWSIAYRVFDAQFWGVPQRRRRIYLVADFRGQCAREILFERQGLRGHLTESPPPRERITVYVEDGSGTADREGETRVIEETPAYSMKTISRSGKVLEEQANPICASDYKDPEIMAYALDQQGGKGGANYAENVMPTLCSDSHGTPHAVAYGISSYDSNAMKSANPHSGIYEAGTSRTLDLNGGNPACNQGGIAIVEHIGIDGYNGELTEDKAATLGVHCGISTGRNGIIEQSVVNVLTPWDSQGNQVTDGTGNHVYGTLRGCGDAGYQAGYVLAKEKPQAICMATQQGGAEIRTDDKAPTLTAAAGMSGNNQPVVAYEPVTFEPGVAKREGGHIYEGVAGTLRANAGDNQLAVAFAQNQRDEIRDLGDKTGALQAQPGMKQQTFIIDSIGGQAESAKETDISPTLKATHYKFPPVVTAASGFCTEHSAQSRSIGYEEETSPTLRAGVTPAVVYDARGNGEGDNAATITGGHESSISDYTNVVVEPMETPPAEAITVHGEQTSGTIMARDYKGAGRWDSLDKVVCQPVAGVDCRNMNEYQELYPTLQAKPNGGQSLNFSGALRDSYIVRRLTPTECARLQGFPDTWGHLEKKEDFTEEEYRFWLEVRNTHAAINGKQVKEHTKAQMLTWYNKLHTDSAEYKMWGNGIALPTALYCMQGIAETMKEERK